MLTCCIFSIFVRWMHLQGKVNQIEWDMATITASDYTVEMTIHKNDYDEWYSRDYKKPGGDFDKDVPPSMSLKKHLIHEIERNLT